MKNITISSALLAFSIFGFNSYAGEISTNNITTFTSGAIISSSEVNTAVSEVVRQINDNNSRITTNETTISNLSPPKNFTNIQSLLTGKYVGTYHGIERIGEPDVNYYASNGLVTINIRNGVGNITFSGKQILAGQLVLVDDADFDPSVSDNSGTSSIRLTADSNGNISATIPSGITREPFVMTGFVDKQGKIIYLSEMGTGSLQFQTLNLFKQ